MRNPDDLRALGGGSIVVFLMAFWAADNGGFDAATWYWGALVCLATLTVVVALGRRSVAAIPLALRVAIGLFALYVAWSYLSITWASYAGLALQGSNRALLYLLVFALMAVLPWRRATALAVVAGYATALGVIAIVYLVRLALGSSVPSMFLDGRLVAPTGYFNSTAALYTIGSLMAVSLAARRGVPGLLQGLMLTFAGAELMLAVTVQSRGWLFTLPIVGLWSVVLIAGRLRTVVAALAPAAGTLVVIHPLLKLFQISQASALAHAAAHAGKIGLLSCAGIFFVSTLVCWIEEARDRPPLGALVRRSLGSAVVLLAVAGLVGGLLAVSGDHPGSFISRQWHGFTSEPTDTATANHFVEVGSGRYDIWRSAWEAFRAHPIGGLGQDNFGDWYLTHRHTVEEPLWTHSLELRLLASTGAVGAALFGAFLLAALFAAVAARRRGSAPDRMLVGSALLALGVWLIHGSIDWFYEIPALSAPALGFLAMAGRLRPAAATVEVPHVATSPTVPARRRRALTVLGTATACLALVGATIVIGLPYLATIELDRGEGASFTDVNASLADFRLSHRLDPLMSDPGELGGEVALVNSRARQAGALFRQATEREPGNWVAWMGRGLVASTLHEIPAARRFLLKAHRIDADQQVITSALSRLTSRTPMTMSQALDQIDYLP